MTNNPKILNLDDFSAGEAKKIIQWKGKSHEMKAFSVKDFIEFSKEVQALEKSNGDNIAIDEFFDLSAKQILRVFPTMSKEDIESMPTTAITAIRDFIAQTASDATEEGLAENGVDNPPKN